MPGPRADPADGWIPLAGAAITFHHRLGRIAVATAGVLLDLWNRHQAHALGFEAFATAGATTIWTGAAQTTALADMFVAHQLHTPPVGLTVPATERPRLEAAVRTAATTAAAPPDVALERLGRSEPLHAAHTAATAAMAARDVTGWQRQTSATPCVICARLSKLGVQPIDKQFWDHPGCSCVAVPIITTVRPARTTPAPEAADDQPEPARP